MVPSDIGLACTAPTSRYPDGRTATSAGYWAHKAVRQEPCKACRLGHLEYGTSTRARAAERRRSDPNATAPACAGPSKKHPEGRTGTVAGFMAHVYYGEKSCEPCLRGNAAASAAYKAADPEGHLGMNLKYKYQLSVDDYLEILDRQGGRCAICRTNAPTDVRTNRFQVDHDHR